LGEPNQTMNIRYRPLQTDQLEEVKSIFDYYTQQTTANLLTEPMGMRDFQRLIHLDHPVYPALTLLNEEDKIVGFCALVPYQNSLAFRRTAEAYVYIKPEYCRKGYGSVALLQLEQQARKTGVLNLLATVTGSAPAAFRMFEQAGYIQIAWYRNIGEKFGMLLDQVVFQKAL